MVNSILRAVELAAIREQKETIFHLNALLNSGIDHTGEALAIFTSSVRLVGCNRHFIQYGQAQGVHLIAANVGLNQHVILPEP